MNLPFGDGLYHLFMVTFGVVYYCYIPSVATELVSGLHPGPPTLGGVLEAYCNGF